MSGTISVQRIVKDNTKAGAVGYPSILFTKLFLVLVTPLSIGALDCVALPPFGRRRMGRRRPKGATLAVGCSRDPARPPADR